MIAPLLSLLTLFTLAVFAQDDGWHFDTIRIIANEQLDPIVTPNAYGTHFHKVIGGSGFSAAYDFNTYKNAICSSLQCQADKSNYWMPGELKMNTMTERCSSSFPLSKPSFGTTTRYRRTSLFPPSSDSTIFSDEIHPRSRSFPFLRV